MRMPTFLRTAALAASGLCSVLTLPSAAVEPAKKLWENSVSLGFTITKGNSDTVLATANWLSARKWESNELRLGADGAYGEADGTRQRQTLHGFVQLNHLFNERAFAYLRADGFHDGVSDIDYRFVLSPGGGYYFIKDEKTLLSGEVGPGWVFEKKGGNQHDYFTLRIAERFEHKFNERVRLWQSLEYLPQVDRWDNFILNAEIGVESALSKSLNLRVFLQDTYVSKPAPSREENDIKLVAALAYKF